MTTPSFWCSFCGNHQCEFCGKYLKKLLLTLFLTNKSWYANIFNYLKIRRCCEMIGVYATTWSDLRKHGTSCLVQCLQDRYWYERGVRQRTLEHMHARQFSTGNVLIVPPTVLSIVLILPLYAWSPTSSLLSNLFSSLSQYSLKCDQPKSQDPDFLCLFLSPVPTTLSLTVKILLTLLWEYLSYRSVSLIKVRWKLVQNNAFPLTLVSSLHTRGCYWRHCSRI